MHDPARNRLLLVESRAAMAAWSLLAWQIKSEFTQATAQSRDTIRSSQKLVAAANKMMSEFPVIARPRRA